ncbi:uncharacterized protein [Narcine bancroftii]|uniref:uncharacterized protein isoform X2 n=1 Tax=Narcine bancroftii TaxID=1343680 RepID=UPI003831EBDE
MATYKTEKTWGDLQNSFNHIRRQLGLVTWTGWDNPVDSDVHQRAHSKSHHYRQKVYSPSSLPRLLVTSNAIPNQSFADLRRGHWEVIPPLHNDRQTSQLSAISQQPAVSVSETLLEEEISDLMREMIRNVFEEFNIHLTTATVNELIMETIEPMVPQIVKETVNEMVLEENILSVVLDEEIRDVLRLQLSECATKVYKQQVEKLPLKTLGNEERTFPEETELDRVLDSSMLDTLLGQYLNVSLYNCALKDYHFKAFTDVALDVILTEMSEWMDDDTADLFQYEN